ncbi:MAG: polyprenyl synthetase family protein [Candidatus Thalassarchaeaceae archaeon]|jgi:geranylgeranyl pyrophosphate synthase|nr:polyprenyl synthetase family protein [Candidatus Thalassarchaeaceae archaeon]
MEAEKMSSMTLDSIKDFVEDSIEELVLEKMSSRLDKPVMSIASDVLLGGGKRYRPILAILSYKAAGGSNHREALDLALSSELIHTATLVHDDVYDQSKMRRGKPTIHSTHGTSHAIITGDYLFTLGFELGARYDERIVGRVRDACAGIASGEILQFEHINDLNTRPEDYYAIIDGKTAGPFAAGCSSAAMIAGSSEEVSDALWGYGMELGRAFQLVDDILDLAGGDLIGKPRGTDVHEGKMTLPIIYGLTMLHGTNRDQLKDVLTNFGDDRLQELVELLEKAGSFEYAKLLVSNHVERALDHIEVLPDSEEKEMLTEIALISESRTN